MDVARLLRDHSKLRSLGADLVMLVSTAEPCNLDELALRRWDLARMVHLHLAYEERRLFNRVELDPRPDVRAAGIKAKQGVEQLHSLYKAHVERWGAEEVLNRWPEFQGAVRTMVARMVAKLDLEEVELFPLVANDEESDRGWQAGMRNWAGDGVALQPFIRGSVLQVGAVQPAEAGGRFSPRRA